MVGPGVGQCAHLTVTIPRRIVDRYADVLFMGSLKKRRKAKINRHKRRKKLRAHRHKKRTWQK